MGKARNVLSLAVVGVVLAVTPALAQSKQTAPAVPEAPSPPSESSLVVGALQVGSAATLEIAGIDISVASDSVVYSYYLKNAGSADLGLAAAVTLPALAASADRSETWVLAANDPENPVGLTITAAGAPVATKAEVHANALGVDRLAEIKADHLPLIPIGPESDKALAALSPDAANRLAALGVVSLRDPKAPKEPLTADWSLEVVRSGRLTLPPGKTTPVVVKFAPIKSRYRMAKADLEDIDDMKEELCLKPQVVSALQSRLKGNGAWNVTDISLASDAPARWIDSPQPTLSVQKPKPDAIVAFCGIDEKTASKPTVLGATPEDSEGIRIVVFEPVSK